MKKLWLFLVVVLLYGCATSLPFTYRKFGASDTDVQTARMECEYDVAKATQNNRYLFGIGDAIASGITQGMEKTRLRDMCMQSKGYSKYFPQETSPTAGNPPNGKGL